MSEESDVRREGEHTEEHGLAWLGLQRRPAAAASFRAISRPRRRAAGIQEGTSEVQARLARRIRQRLHPAVVPEAAAVEAHLPKSQEGQSGQA